jgi:hypothetical protein
MGQAHPPGIGNPVVRHLPLRPEGDGTELTQFLEVLGGGCNGTTQDLGTVADAQFVFIQGQQQRQTRGIAERFDAFGRRRSRRGVRQSAPRPEDGLRIEGFDLAEPGIGTATRSYNSFHDLLK